MNRKAIEDVVSRHRVWSKVATYYSEKTGESHQVIQRKFIDFLLSERFYMADGKPRNVLCFTFDIETREFDNRTVCGAPKRF